MVRDHNGCSALHYAANTNSFLTEDIIHVLMEALSQKGTHTRTHTHTLTSFVSLFAISVHSASSYFTNKFSLTGNKLITRPGKLNATDDFVTMASPAGNHCALAFTSHLPTLCSPRTISIATASPMAAVSSIPHKLLRNSFRDMKNWPIFQTPSVTYTGFPLTRGGPIPQDSQDQNISSS